MVFRLADKKDISSLAELRWLHEEEECDLFGINKEEFINECSIFLTNGLVNNEWVYWIAEEDKEIVANIYVRRIRKVPKPQKFFAEIGYVTNVHTKEQYRGKGIGSELLAKVKQWSVDNKIELLFLWPSKRAVDFYNRQGFDINNEIMELEF
ncbi:GNAT family N-acetyltransferase [Clostridium manihotivorum]|uniref:GNAT family N-acetyltransferase n=1 Tax=Clostridium manihotivorum TaxID=2320868 RepID=A0A410DWB4_9CLOT|nr:GNAT family N-acetyltransferase [Clostridium manihotivorum]QAA33375.1 GNAT family N-acetyltransferase [Clostridium manihotivorum]